MQMYWKRQYNQTLILYVQHDRAFLPYSSLPQTLQAAEDTVIKGVRTMQKLIGLGYALVPEPKLLPLSGLSEAQRSRWSA